MKSTATMAFYWSTKSIPELRALPPGVRKEVVERAIRTFSVTFWSAMLITGFMIGGVGVAVLVGITVGWLAGALLGEALCLFGKPLVLNLARPRIRELLGYQQDSACD
jgi:hypothetical protein